MEWNPHANNYPPITGDAFDRLKADIAKNGVQEPIKVRLLVNGQREGVDGRNRKRACNELGIDCPEEVVEVADWQIVAYIDSLNLHRRHLTADERQRHVARYRGEGMSTREIAGKLGTSHATVLRDIKEQPPADVPEVVQGRDGRQYRPVDKSRWCERCQRVGAQTINCPSCARAAAKASSRGRPAKKPAAVPAKAAPVPSSAGSPAFDDLHRQLLQLVEDTARANGGRSPRSEGMKRQLAEVAASWQEWQKHLGGK